VAAPAVAGVERVLTPDATTFITDLCREFAAERLALLSARQQRWLDFSAGKLPDFLPETAHVRAEEWQVAPPPPDLQDRRVEITGPVDRKMVINALNSGANVFMADFEDSLAPTWANVIAGQLNMHDAVRRTISFDSPEGKVYRLKTESAVLMVRPRGWHLTERHVLVDGQPASGSLVDFGLYLFHNAEALLERGTGPYYYLPKLESHQEARLWAKVFGFAERRLGLQPGTIRCTVLIETLPAALEMEEILYELRQHIVGLNAGRWDYLFSMIKKFHRRPEFLLPDRAQLTMTVPFMRAYTELLVKTCHKRGAHAIGGMAAFVPNRKDPDVTERAIEAVRRDKTREAGDGFDGTWVAHPDLVPIALTVFDGVLGDSPHQKDRQRHDVSVTAQELLDVGLPEGSITEAGMRNNINVALQYIAAWRQGTGAVTIHNLMEDAATAEIARSQLWQWAHHQAKLADGRTIDFDLYRALRADESAKLEAATGIRYLEAVNLLDNLVLADPFVEFFTLPAYQSLNG